MILRPDGGEGLRVLVKHRVAGEHGGVYPQLPVLPLGGAELLVAVDDSGQGIEHGRVEPHAVGGDGGHIHLYRDGIGAGHVSGVVLKILLPGPVLQIDGGKWYHGALTPAQRPGWRR